MEGKPAADSQDLPRVYSILRYSHKMNEHKALHIVRYHKGMEALEQRCEAAHVHAGRRFVCAARSVREQCIRIMK